MRILVLQDSDWIERGPHQSHHLLERLSKRGHEVRVVDFEPGWRDHPGIGIAGRRAIMAHPNVVEGAKIEVVRPAMVRLPVLDYLSAYVTHAVEIRRQFRDYHPDVILGLGLLDSITGIRLARRGKIPFVCYLIDELHRLVPQLVFQGLARIVEQATLHRADITLSISRALQDYSVAMGAPAERTRVVPGGVDFDRFSSAGNGSDVRTRHGIAVEDLVLFYMGWVYPFSGVREVAEALVAGEGQEVRAKLLVVGKGDSWHDMIRFVKHRGAEDRIKMVDFRPYREMPTYLAAADVCILPALKVQTMQNIVPIKVYEYLASGRPVIATRLPGLVREFGEGNGLVYVDSPGEVVPKAIQLARDGSGTLLGQKGRAFVAGNDWNRISNSFEGYLTEITAKGYNPG